MEAFAGGAEFFPKLVHAFGELVDDEVLDAAAEEPSVTVADLIFHAVGKMEEVILRVISQMPLELMLPSFKPSGACSREAASSFAKACAFVEITISMMAWVANQIKQTKQNEAQDLDHRCLPLLVAATEEIIDRCSESRWGLLATELAADFAIKSHDLQTVMKHILEHMPRLKAQCKVARI